MFGIEHMIWPSPIFGLFLVKSYPYVAKLAAKHVIMNTGAPTIFKCTE